MRAFIQANYTPYEGDAAFLAGPTDRTLAVWQAVAALFPEERRKGVLDVDTATPSTITSHAPGYIAELAAAYDRMLGWLAATYVSALNVIHYMHDKYAYERIEMALHDHPVHRTMACGIGGLSVAADSLSAVRHSRVHVVRGATGIAVDHQVHGDYPAYGNDDDRADGIAVDLVRSFMAKVRRHSTYRTAEHTQSVLDLAGGGVVTGGEPLLQSAFTAEVLHRCKELGLHTALDTSGALGPRADDALLADTDLVLLDIKSFDAAVYRRLTGGHLAPTLDFATRLNRLGVPARIRYVLVPGRTDEPAAIDSLAGFLTKLDNIDRVDVLPFHKLGAPKYGTLGTPFPLRDNPVPDGALVDRVRDQFRAHGLRAL